MDIPRIQKWIIITAAFLGMAISLGGVTYRNLFANQPAIQPAQPNTKSAQVSLLDTNNFYAKVKSGQPVQVLFLGEENPRNQLFLDQFKKELEEQFPSKLSISSITSLNGTSWGNLITLNQVNNKNRPDLILICSGSNDQKELSPEQFKTIYEATIQAIGKKYPNTEIMLVQEPTLNEVTQEIHRKLANHYNLPLVVMREENTKKTITKVSYADVVQKKLNTNPSICKTDKTTPFWDIEKFKTYHAIQTYSATNEMEQAKSAEGNPIVSSSKSGSFVESTFEGSALGLTVACGPDGGVARPFLDGRKYNIIDTYSPEPGIKHILLADNLGPGEHRIKVIVLGQGKYPSKGATFTLQGFDVVGE